MFRLRESLQHLTAADSPGESPQADARATRATSSVSLSPHPAFSEIARAKPEASNLAVKPGGGATQPVEHGVTSFSTPVT